MCHLSNTNRKWVVLYLKVNVGIMTYIDEQAQNWLTWLTTY